ncbi:MAG TPA: beta-propeller fold lactonase family protein [Roseiflexaceae bacterium]|nr:beta-propeller fold lactonase family protein [Roseiflexaceae bacterium]
MPSFHHTLRRLAPALVGVLLLALFAPARPAFALPTPIPIQVTTTAVAQTNGDGCSLYEALNAAFNQKFQNKPSFTDNECTVAGDPTAPVVITFTGNAAGAVITANKSLPLPMINRSVTLVGPVILDGGGLSGQPTNQYILRNAAGGILTLTGLTIRNGYTAGSGAAILDDAGGTINLSLVSVLNNVAENDGGAIYSNGTVNIAGGAFTGNQARGVYPGGGNNSGTGYGGAIVMTGSGKLNVSLTAFSGNTARQRGGALYILGQAKLTDVSLNGNVVSGSEENNGGGAIYLSGTGGGAALGLERVAVSGNLATGSHGGALFAGFQTTTVISDTSFNGNIAGNPLLNNGASYGGAIYSQRGEVRIGRSTFIANVAAGSGGAIANDRGGILTVANSHFDASLAKGDSSTGGTLWNGMTYGGGLSNATLRNVTIADTSANTAKAILNQPGHTVAIANTIIDGGDAACGGTITSQGHNIDAKNSCGLTQTGDQPNTDPKIDLPGFNGGPISSLLTRPLKSDSPAIDAGDQAVCDAAPVGKQDIRGKDRPKDGDGKQGKRCDIGAFENEDRKPGYGSTPVQPGPIPFGSAVANQGTTTAVLQVFNTGNAPLEVNTPAISGPAAADFSIDPNLSLTINDSTPQPVALTCAPKGIGSRVAKLQLKTNDPDHATVSYDLTCTGTAAPAAGFLAAPAAPGPLDLGKVKIGQKGSAQISVKNTGNLPLTLGPLSKVGLHPSDFGVIAPQSIDPGATAAVTVECQPSGAGVRSASLTIPTNDPNTASVTYTLSCTGEVVPPPPLSATGQALNVAPGGAAGGPYGLAISPDGRSVYAVDRLDNAVSLYSRSAATGALTYQTTYTNGQGGISGMSGPYKATVSPDGKNVYVSAGTSQAVVVFGRNPVSGALTYQSHVKNGDPYSCVLPPDCGLTVSGLGGAYDIAVSADGQYLYVSSIADSAIVVLGRNTTDGSLTSLLGVNFIQKLSTGAPAGVTLTSAYGLALSPDGQNLYATGYSSDTLLVFRRNAADGTLTYLEKFGTAQAPSLDGVFRVAVSPDGGSVYTASFNSDSLTAFRRSTGDGRLTYQASYTQGIGGLDGLLDASAVTVSPDNAWVYAAGFSSSALSVYKRDPVSGQLEQRQVLARGDSGTPPLEGARDVVVSPDGRTIIASGYTDNRIVAFQVSNPAPTLLSLSPGSVAAGAGDLTLTVNGSDFVDGAVVQWNNVNQPTSFASANKLVATIPAALLQSAGTAAVRVVNPTPGGGPSNTVDFTLVPGGQTPAPGVSGVAPQAAPAGSPSVLLTITGSNFTSASVVQWNGAPRPTTFVSAGTLQALISAADLAQPGASAVTVFTPAPGGGTSNAASFSVSAPGQNPAPSILTAAPLFATAGDTSFTLVIEGSNFTEESVVRWDGDDRPTDYVSPTRLEAAITAADVAAPGSASITVFTPAPGGGESNPALFTIGELGDNPVPALTDVQLTLLPGGGMTVTLLGSGFVEGAAVLWNGAQRAPTAVAPGQITFTITIADFSRGPAVINVVNPAPGGGTSNDLLLQVRQTYFPFAKR